MTTTEPDLWWEFVGESRGMQSVTIRCRSCHVAYALFYVDGRRTEMAPDECTACGKELRDDDD